MASIVTSEQETGAEASLQSKFEAQRNKLQVIVQSEFGLLSKLLSSKVLTVTDLQTIKADNTTIGRNQKLLETIFERGKYHEFIDALRYSGQTHVVNWINGNGVYRPEFGLDWPLMEREIEILDSNYAQLGEILNVKEELIRILFSKVVLNVRQKDFISSKSTICEANEAFLDILRQSSLKAYFLTVESLRKLNEVCSANILDNGAIAVPVHVNLGGQNVDEMETQLVKKWTLLFLEDTASCDTPDFDNLLAWLRVSVISVKKGSSIVLFVSCCTVDEYRRLCTLVDDNDIIKKVIEKLFNQLLQNFMSNVLLVRIDESDRKKAEKLFQRELLRDKKYDNHFQQLCSQLRYEEPMEMRTEESIIEEANEEEFPQESEDPGIFASAEEDQDVNAPIVFGLSNFLESLRMDNVARILEPLPGFIELTYEPCMINLDDDDPRKARAKMPCGHVISTTAMMNYCTDIIKRGRFKFPCANPTCRYEWEYFLVRHVACFTEEEMQNFEKRLNQNFLNKEKGIQNCPGCQVFCYRRQGTGNRVCCPMCTKSRGRKYDFCWICLNEWKSDTSLFSCGNQDCDGKDKRIEILARCPTKIICGKECPSIRGCPNCGLLIEHKDKCAHMKCTNCPDFGFCFACLRKKENDKWKCKRYPVSCAVAPRQTTLPETQ